MTSALMKFEPASVLNTQMTEHIHDEFNPINTETIHFLFLNGDKYAYLRE